MAAKMFTLVDEELPKRHYNREGGAGRPRQPNEFDEAVQASFDSGKAAKVPAKFVDSEEKYKAVIRKIRASADYLGYGVDISPDENGNLYFRARARRKLVRKPKGKVAA